MNARGVGLAMIMVDPADNSQQGMAGDDAKNDTDAKTKIDDIYQQLKSGADFATVARAKSEDANSLLKGGDIGFATEDGSENRPDSRRTWWAIVWLDANWQIHRSGNWFPVGKWYIFKLQEKRWQTENLTLESQGVRQQITRGVDNQRKEILNAALLEVAMSEAKIVNNLAANMLSNPAISGLRPASPRRPSRRSYARGGNSGFVTRSGGQG